jgi:hypothetical protein
MLKKVDSKIGLCMHVRACARVWVCVCVCELFFKTIKCGNLLFFQATYYIILCPHFKHCFDIKMWHNLRHEGQDGFWYHMRVHDIRGQNTLQCWSTEVVKGCCM